MRKIVKKLSPFILGMGLLLPTTIQAEASSPTEATQGSAVTMNVTATEFLRLSISGAREFNFNSANLSEGWSNFSTSGSFNETTLSVDSSRPFAVSVIADDVFREADNPTRTLPIERLRIGARTGTGMESGNIATSDIKVTHSNPSLMSTDEPIILAESNNIGNNRQARVQFAFERGFDIAEGQYSTSVTFSAFQQ